MANDRRSVPAVRVLVVEDFEAFRRFICSLLAQSPGLQIVGEVSDGLEAVRKAEELQPDLILMDLGLPMLNGIAAARRIRTLSPKSKIIFVTQQLDSDVVREALDMGANGYVAKTRTAIDLPVAVEVVLKGGQFVSGGLLAPEFATQATIISIS
jgi:DNA-binding NarL/FixJ family response regulator